jgi:hypothetical protein
VIDGLCGLGVFRVFVGDSIPLPFPSSRPKPPVGDSIGLSCDVMTMTGDDGTADAGTGGTGGISVDCDNNAFVFGAETTRRSHLVAADPFDGVVSLLSSGDGGGMSLFRLGVLGIVPDVLSFDSEGDREEDPID